MNNESSSVSFEREDSMDTTYLKHIVIDSESIHRSSDSNTDSISQSEFSEDSRKTMIIISESSVYPKSTDISIHSTSQSEYRSSRDTIT